jgi:HSP20 family protein
MEVYMSSRKGKIGGLEGILGGVADLIEKLGDLAEKGEQLSKTVQFQGTGPAGKDIKGVYGFSIKTGLGGEELTVEPFGNIRRDERTGRPVVQEIREPVVDVFEEGDHTLVVAEMPGIGEEDARLEVKDDLLTLYAEKGSKKYRKEILLPRSYPREKMHLRCNNGVLEITCSI